MSTQCQRQYLEAVVGFGDIKGKAVVGSVDIRKDPVVGS